VIYKSGYIQLNEKIFLCREFDNFPEGEIDEMVELYENKGISTEDAKLVVNTLAKYKEAFIDIMMVEELNLMPIDEDDSPLMGGMP